ncbi:hypothetical protein PGUG_00113 [Meyerozyma guilliermondii ATCC 6260]|uniref:Uncharacterized protein n=1 Tax=Meyerozyma guilliermondii (strain ATCC 6260 / CBS 566 / DSM 6381 / JCM 1539 / NBRC 10279 / NRRL Y-324) TaxID=294746 RepID=A5DA08_PICGU|nr:uncharacterized protein PGUG_00113 [Meyerozyma guilliermondii ATCC 6260]EDK36015.2 hypothetical protein PGUG_00113 [Meyerozyma guilliermondii ATCC 6260]
MNNRNHNGELGKYPQEGRDTYDSDSSSEFSRSVAESAADSDQGHSDNISTIPLKSITSIPSTKSPSVLSDKDNNSYMASTAETSLAPSGHTVGLPSPQTTAQTASTSAASASNTPVNDRDQESIVTLASSSRRVRRRSLDTNSSTTGIAPASIMERLSVHPTAASAPTHPVPMLLAGTHLAPKIAISMRNRRSMKRKIDEENDEENEKI